MSTQPLKNPHLRYSEVNSNLKNIYMQLLDSKNNKKISPLDVILPEADYQLEQGRNTPPKDYQDDYIRRSGVQSGKASHMTLTNSINKATKMCQPQETLGGSRMLRGTGIFRKRGLERQKSFERSLKNQSGDNNNFRTSASSNIIFKYSQSIKGSRKDSIQKSKLCDPSIFRKTFNNTQKSREQKVSLQKPTSLANLQNTLTYLQSRVNNAKIQLFRKKQKKLNTSSQDYPNNILEQQFTKQNIKQSQISENSTGTVKKSSHLRISSLVAGQSKPKQLKYFDKNPYSPKRSNIYYVSEVVRAIHQKNSIAIQHISSSIRILKYLANNQQIPPLSEIQQRKLNLKKKQFYKNKKTIVFDLDETLIHCNQNSVADCDVKLPIDFGESEKFLASINIRPHAMLMLNQLAKNFEIMVFTASQSSYADVVLDYLDPNKKIFQHRLFREHCTQTSKGMYVKDLRIINRNLSQMVIVDNSAYSYAYQLQNGIPILPYYQGSIDFELKVLTEYLNQLVSVKDVRQINKKTFKLHHYTKFDNAQQLIQELYMNV